MDLLEESFGKKALNILKKVGVAVLFMFIAAAITGNATLSWVLGILIFYLEIRFIEK